MLSRWVVEASCLAYVGTLFAIAWWVDRHAERSRTLLANPWVYTLSLGAYATAWTFYGSAGLAAVDGPAFLPIYLGVSLAALLAGVVVRRMVRAVHRYHVTSIADLAAIRYGRSSLVGAAVALVAIIGLVPYLALQLKAISQTFLMLATGAPGASPASEPIWHDTALYAVLLLAAFAILFGARALSPTERHDGLVAAIAVESLAKLAAALTIGTFVTFVLYQGIGDLFAQAAARLPHYERLVVIGGDHLPYSRWLGLLVVTTLVGLLLPSQFHLAAVENRDEKHLEHVPWLFPLYMLAITLFVLPVALAGLMKFPSGTVKPDTFTLALPMVFGPPWLALLVFLGGLSAATAHVIVNTLALSIMACNNLVLPALLRFGRGAAIGAGHDGRWVLHLRHALIVLLLALAYGYLHLMGDTYALVEIGLPSFVAVAQFAPLVLGGLFWRLGTRRGALAGLSLGFLAWSYTLLVPIFAQAGWLPSDLIDAGPFGLAWLKPTALFGLEGIDWISHGLFWSLLVNTAGYLGFSLTRPQTAEEQLDAAHFVDGLAQDLPGEMGHPGRLASAADLHGLLARFLGTEFADQAMARFAQERDVEHWRTLHPDSDMVGRIENLLAGAIGTPSARILVDSVLKQAPVSRLEVMEIVDETSHAIAYSHHLEEQSRQMEALAAALRESEERLHAIIENAPTPIFLKGTDGRYLLVNWQYAESFQVGQESVKGKTDRDLFPAAVADLFVRGDRQVLATGQPQQMEETAPGPEGMRTYLTVKFPLRNAQGEIYALCGVATDITERQQAEAAVRALNRDLETRSRQLEAVNKELEAFSYSVSHDLRAPLRGINGFCRILMEECAEQLDDQARQYLQRIVEATRRLSELIDDLLALSLASRSEMSREDIDLSAMVRHIADGLRTGQPEHEVQVLIQEGMHTHADPRLMHVLLDNLIGNAWKYTGKRLQARIEFGSLPATDGAIYFVRDNGAGFDMRYADRLFKPFQRLHGATDFPGTGIGLATVQRIVHRHGGKIWAESAVGQGAAFYFTLSPEGSEAPKAETT